MNNNSIWANIFSIVGFFVVIGLLVSMLGGLLGFALHILLPMALVVWLVRFIFNIGSQHKQSYR